MRGRSPARRRSPPFPRPRARKAGAPRTWRSCSARSACATSWSITRVMSTGGWGRTAKGPRRSYWRRGPFAVLPQPPVDITRVIDHDVAQADRAEQLRHVRGAPAFRARGRGNGGERRLAGERPLIGALDVMARRANAIVREQVREGVIHGPSL